SKELVLLVFGMQWEKSVLSFQILSLSIGFQILLSTSGSIFQAANSTKTLFFSGLISTIINVFAILIGVFVFKTIEAVAFGLLFSFILNFFQAYYFMYNRVFRLKMIDFFRQLILPLIISIFLFGILAGVNVLTLNLYLIISLGIKTLISFSFVLLFIQYAKVYDLIFYLRKFLDKKK
ncbi:MAG: polysaccharide biosynthesis C-terminal domain-containing protein, partial [Bacteroidales bacterium]